MSTTFCHYCYSEKLHFGRFREYFFCKVCKSLGSKRNFSEKDLSIYYGSYYGHGNLSIPKLVKDRLRSQIQHLEKYRSKEGTFLDIGFGAGALLEAAESLDWNVFGTEISESAIQSVRDKNWQVKLGDFNPHMFQVEFDVVCLMETIEHLADPESIIKKIYQKVRPGGVLFGTTPNSSSLNRRILNEYWSILGVPEHLNLASKAGLSSLLYRNGFRKVSIKSSGFNPFDLILKFKSLGGQSAKSESLSGRVDFGYNLNEKMFSSVFLSSVRASVQNSLNLFNLGDSLVFTAEK